MDNDNEVEVGEEVTVEDEMNNDDKADRRLVEDRAEVVDKIVGGVVSEHEVKIIIIIIDL